MTPCYYLGTQGSKRAVLIPTINTDRQMPGQHTYVFSSHGRYNTISKARRCRFRAARGNAFQPYDVARNVEKPGRSAIRSL